MTSARILVCDDEPAIRKTLIEVLEDESFDCEGIPSGEKLLSTIKMADRRIDLILLDVWLPGMDGVETLAKMREMGVQIPVIVISGHANLETAIQATKLGAFDFLEKPLNLDRVLLSVKNALRQARLERREKQLIANQEEVVMIGDAPTMKSLRSDIEMAAPTAGRVLILGESGSGKEVAAKLVHQLSERAHEAFVEMNCAAIPEELVESELFGHMKGSFTGAVDNRMGKFEQADGGTLFLDEIGDMSLGTQAKVLRVLQEQRFQRIGGSKTIVVDVRVIAATNKDLSEEIKAGRFREDLYFRLNVIPLNVPPLRERPEDIPVLARHFLQFFAKSYKKPSLDISQACIERFVRYIWPGNVRELRNMMERLVIMCRSELIEVQDLPAVFQDTSKEHIWFGGYDSLKSAREFFEKKFIEYQLKKHDGNVSKTAETIQLERSNLHKKIKQYDIQIGG